MARCSFPFRAPRFYDTCSWPLMTDSLVVLVPTAPDGEPDQQGNARAWHRSHSTPVILQPFTMYTRLRRSPHRSRQPEQGRLAVARSDSRSAPVHVA